MAPVERPCATIVFTFSSFSETPNPAESGGGGAGVVVAVIISAFTGYPFAAIEPSNEFVKPSAVSADSRTLTGTPEAWTS